MPAPLSQCINHPLSIQGQGINTLKCGNDSIFLHIPKPLQQQICKDEYINLALLLKEGMELKDFFNGGALKVNSEGGTEMKSDAFLIYTSVFLTAHQDKACELMHYIILIREAASKERGTTMNNSEFARQITTPPGRSSIMTYEGIVCRSELLTQSANQLGVQQRKIILL